MVLPADHVAHHRAVKVATVTPAASQWSGYSVARPMASRISGTRRKAASAIAAGPPMISARVSKRRTATVRIAAVPISATRVGV